MQTFLVASDPLTGWANFRADQTAISQFLVLLWSTGTLLLGLCRKTHAGRKARRLGLTFVARRSSLVVNRSSADKKNVKPCIADPDR